MILYIFFLLLNRQSHKNGIRMIYFQDGIMWVTWSDWVDDVSCVAYNKYKLTVVHLTKDLDEQVLDEIHTNIVQSDDNLSEGSHRVTLTDNGKRITETGEKIIIYLGKNTVIFVIYKYEFITLLNARVVKASITV